MKRATPANDAGGWDAVPQVPASRATSGAPVSLMLRPVGRSLTNKLWLSVSPQKAAELKWRLGVALALAVGTGRYDGWLRIWPVDVREGRQLRKLGGAKQATFALHAVLQPPGDLMDIEAPREICEHQVDGEALLVKLPWDLTEARAELARAA
jgi:hypothetical protein